MPGQDQDARGAVESTVVRLTYFDVIDLPEVFVQLLRLVEQVAQWVEANPSRPFARFVYWLAGQIEVNFLRVLVGALAAMFTLMMALIAIIELVRYWVGLPPLGAG